MTNSFLRQRVGGTPIIAADLSAPHGKVGLQPAKAPQEVSVRTGALSRIMAGLFGLPYPKDNASAQVVARSKAQFYEYHQGDLFTPGTQNYVFEPNFENPLQTVWGRGFLRTPNTFGTAQPPQVYVNPAIQLNGIGGVQAGQFVFHPIESNSI